MSTEEKYRDVYFLYNTNQLAFYADSIYGDKMQIFYVYDIDLLEDDSSPYHPTTSLCYVSKHFTGIENNLVFLNYFNQYITYTESMGDSFNDMCWVNGRVPLNILTCYKIEVSFIEKVELDWWYKVYDNYRQKQ